VRLQRTPRVDDALEMSLEETLGAEEAVLVIVDPADLPKSWGSIDLLAEGIGDAAYRVSPEVAAGTSSENADSMTAEQANALSYSAGCIPAPGEGDLRRPSPRRKAFPCDAPTWHRIPTG